MATMFVGLLIKSNAAQADPTFSYNQLALLLLAMNLGMLVILGPIIVPRVTRALADAAGEVTKRVRHAPLNLPFCPFRHPFSMTF